MFGSLFLRMHGDWGRGKLEEEKKEKEKNEQSMQNKPLQEAIATGGVASVKR